MELPESKNKKSFFEWQHEVDKTVNQLGGYWPPLGMLAAAVEEMGEVARVMNRIEGVKNHKKGETPQMLGEELADTIYALLCIANSYNLNMDNEMDRILHKFLTRDANRFVSNGS
jgi:NTP pyrophosphatase (non-canonical NTP hydrolase)